MKKLTLGIGAFVLGVAAGVYSPSKSNTQALAIGVLIALPSVFVSNVIADTREQQFKNQIERQASTLEELESVMESKTDISLEAIEHALERESFMTELIEDRERLIAKLELAVMDKKARISNLKDALAIANEEISNLKIDKKNLYDFDKALIKGLQEQISYLEESLEERTNELDTTRGYKVVDRRDTFRDIKTGETFTL